MHKTRVVLWVGVLLFLFGGFFAMVNSEPLEQTKNLCFPLEVFPVLLEVFSDGGLDN